LILFIVNAGLITIEETIVFQEEGKAGTLRPIMYQLLVNHLLHLFFKRHFLDSKRKINRGHKWIWIFNLGSYSYISYVYFFTDAKKNSKSDYSKCWIPLDLILMALVAMYYFSSIAIEKFKDQNRAAIEQEEAVTDSKAEQRKIWESLLSLTERNHQVFDSIYEVEKPKVQHFKLKADASTLGFACYLKKE
jgi:hypothetical protein